MSNELSILALSGLWVCTILVFQVLAAIGQRGVVALVHPRDDWSPLDGKAGRLDRALNNSIIALALFTPAILVLNSAAAFTPLTLVAAQVFLVSRIAYLVLYFLGTPWLRTVTWVAGFSATALLYFLAL